MQDGGGVRGWFIDPVVLKLAIAGLGILLVFMLRRLLDRVFTYRIGDRDARYRVKRFLVVVSYFAAAIVIAVVYSDRLGGFTVALGVAGAGIAFALQEVIASVAGWLAVSFGGFFKVGDRVQLGGIRGDVIDIGILRTTLMECGEWIQADIYTGRVVRVANSFVFKEPVFNYSGDFPFLWDEIRIPVKHGTDHRLARDVLTRVVTEVTGPYAREVAAAWEEIARRFRVDTVALDPAVTLVVNDNWLEYSVRYPVHYRGRRAVKDMLFGRLLDEFAANGVPLASATFHLVEAPPIDVRMRS